MLNREVNSTTAGGWGMLTTLIIALLAIGGGVWAAILLKNIFLVVGVAFAFLFWIVLICGFFTLQPNQAAVLILFGRYVGTSREEGFRWANPFLWKQTVSLRARNLNMQPIKVNDQRGNPIDIAAVVVWRVEDTAQAVFDVDNFEQYVAVQSEAALRHLASAYPYDSTDEHVLSLRGSMDEVSAALKKELQERLHKAGVAVDDARLSHLAYSAEIAGAMLQRQQAEAIVAARTRIVEGAVGIVEMALAHLDRSTNIKLDDERRAAMVNNLLVVLCGDKSAHPVVNAGTLYS